MLRKRSIQALALGPGAESPLAWPTVLGIGAFGLPVVWHLVQLWQRPHYQFFPLVLVAALLLFFVRWSEHCETRKNCSNVFSKMALSSSLFLLLFSAAVGSPWLGMVAAIVAIAGWLVRIAGPGTFWSIAPSWCLLWLLIPPPLGLDERVIVRLQSITTRLASDVADWLAIDHLRQGNTIRLPGHDLFVDEACSGVNSLLAILALAAIIVVWNRRSIPHGLLLFGLSVVWACTCNSVRVTTIMAAFAWRGWDLSEGTPHQFLGGLILLPLAGMVFMSDSALAFLFRPLSPTNSPLSAIWNRWISYSQISKDRPELPRRNGVHPNVSAVATATPARLGRLVWSVICVGAIAWQLVAFRQAQTSLSIASLPPEFERQIRLIEPPAEIGEWKRREFRNERRSRDDNLGENSQVWTYARGPDVLAVSIDFPFTGWHELAVCYSSLGWQVESRRMSTIRVAEEERTDVADVVEIALRNSNGEVGHVIFSLFDASCNPVREDKSLRGLLNSRLLAGFRTQSSIPAPQSVQVQIFLSSDVPLSTVEKASLRDHFAQWFRMILIQLSSAGTTAP